jgi:RNA polymerase sigma-70 factor, ECF subfamily
MGADENEFVRKATNGDSHAFGRLYDMHVARVYRHIYYRVGNTADAEDLTQKVFLKAWQAIGRFKKTASPFLAWLFTISNNLVIDYYRSQKSNVPLERGLPYESSDPGPEEAAETNLVKQELNRAILRLSPDQQKVVMLRFVEGFSSRETASALGKSEVAVRGILFRALKQLRVILEKQQ